jgi:uncharacterized protein DUF6084
MPELSFGVENAEAVPFAAQPLLALKLRVENADASEVIHTVMLRAQIQIEAPRRQYSAAEKRDLLDLFGPPERWSQTLKPMLWTHANVVIQAFTASTVADLQIPCTFDFNVAATKYFHAISEGEIPLNLLFSGSVFYSDQEGKLQITPIPWNKEARFRLPAHVWRGMMDLYYPNSAFLYLRRDVFERLYEYKTQRGIPTWEQTLESLLAAEQEPVRQ